MAVKLACEAVEFKYGQRTILSEVSFAVEAGTFCCILGRNGCGKTTLVHCLNGILTPCGGVVRIDGHDVAAMSTREIARHASLVAQEHLEIFPFSVLDVVVMGRTPYLGLTSTPGARDRELALEALRALSAEGLAHCNFNRISGGERQIALLAKALVQTTDIMLLDEPTNHLDFNNQYRLLWRIKELCRTRGTCIVACMHDPNLATLFADQVIMIRAGRVIHAGPAAQVMTAETVSDLYETEIQRVTLSEGGTYFLPRKVFEDARHDRNHRDR